MPAILDILGVVMPDEVIITEAEESQEATSAHEAAVSEGASGVHQDNAQEAADEAKQAAEATLETAKVQVEVAAQAEQSAQRAEAAAGEAGVSLEAIHAALLAQGDAINVLTSEFRDSREPAEKSPVDAPPDTSTGGTPPKSDTPPKRRHWYYGR